MADRRYLAVKAPRIKRVALCQELFADHRSSAAVHWQ